ncbi:MAG: T9SS type A sorting domain-containing protein [Salibacteraceae bacterium]
MKKIYTTFSILLLGLALNAQVERVPMFEIFSSSTCPPCKSASDVYNPYLDQFHGQIAVVKYPMSWPGAGDPYFMEEFNDRRHFYEVTGAPSLFMNGTTTSAQSLDSNYFLNQIGQECFMDIKLNYFIDESKKRVYFKLDFEALDDYSGDDYKLYMSINEKLTYDNATTNGETEFHHIIKKLLPDHEGVYGYMLGDDVTNGTTYDTTGYFEFTGDYRLPSGANDAVDVYSEHSIEEFNDLEMVAWVNNTGTKEVVQSAIGKKVNSLDKIGDFGDDEEEEEDPTDKNSWQVGIDEFNDVDITVFPNPVKDQLNIKLSNAQSFSVILTDLLGKQVMNKSYESASSKVLSVGDLPNGVYMIEVRTEHSTFFDRLIIK